MNVFVDADSIGEEFAENPDAFLNAMQALSKQAAGLFFDDMHDVTSPQVAQFLRKVVDAIESRT